MNNRETFASVFSGTHRDAAGFIQWTEETPAGLFVYMDTVDAGRHGGLYCHSRMAWLTQVLDGARAASQKAYLFMHHNPVRVNVANADVIGIFNERELQALLKAYSDTVAHLFFGHCHYSLSGAVGGIPYSAPRSTNHTCWPDFTGQINRMGYGDLAPNYNVCFLGQDSTVIHSIDFLDAGQGQVEDRGGCRDGVRIDAAGHLLQHSRASRQVSRTGAPTTVRSEGITRNARCLDAFPVG